MRRARRAGRAGAQRRAPAGCRAGGGAGDALRPGGQHRPLGEAHGVGSCPAPVFGRDNPRRARELLGVPPEQLLVTVIGLGYPADGRARFGPADRHGELRRGRRPVWAFLSCERDGRGSG